MSEISQTIHCFIKTSTMFFLGEFFCLFFLKIKTHRLKKMGLRYAIRHLIFSSPGFQADFKSAMCVTVSGCYWWRVPWRLRSLKMQISSQMWCGPLCLWNCSCNKSPHTSILKRCTIAITHLSLGFIPSFSPRPALVSPLGNSSQSNWRVDNMTHRNTEGKRKTWDPNTHLCACASSGGIWSLCTVIFKESVYPKQERKLSPADMSFTISSTVETLYYMWLIYIFILYITQMI